MTDITIKQYNDSYSRSFKEIKVAVSLATMKC